MPSCTSADLSLQLTPPTLLAAAGPQGSAPAACWKESYCEEVPNGRPRCPPGRCRAGGTEHAKIPCPDHERPFGREVAEGAAPAAEAAAPKRQRSAPRRKPAAKRKPATKRKAATRRRRPASSARGRKRTRAARKPAKRRR